MKNLLSKVAVFPIILLLFFTNCTKNNLEDTKPKNATVPSENYFANSLQSSKPSLEEFINSAETEEEINFFETTEITDNTSIVNEAFDTEQRLQAKPKVKFKWHGKGGTGGCVKPLGVCIIIPLGLAEANVDLMIYQNKYILVYEENQDDNGLTSDGYLPIMENVYVDENITILAGIYKANFNAERNEYSAVGIDIQ
jgi:hypothetical protein